MRYFGIGRKPSSPPPPGRLALRQISCNSSIVNYFLAAIFGEREMERERAFLAAQENNEAFAW